MESGKIIVVANQKGGVAKTSTVRNLSYALAEMGKKVLVVDFDPQYNLTTSFGVLPTQAPYNTGTLITSLLLDESLPDTNEFIQKIGSVDLIPSSRSLTVAEANLLMTPDSNDYLAALLNPLRLSYDYIIVDTNPSLGSLTINALTAADEVIIPIDPELFALTGLQALVDTIKKIKRKLNPSIEIGGKRTAAQSAAVKDFHRFIFSFPPFPQAPTSGHFVQRCPPGAAEAPGAAPPKKCSGPARCPRSRCFRPPAYFSPAP